MSWAGRLNCPQSHLQVNMKKSGLAVTFKSAFIGSRFVTPAQVLWGLWLCWARRQGLSHWQLFLHHFGWTSSLSHGYGCTPLTGGITITNSCSEQHPRYQKERQLLSLRPPRRPYQTTKKQTKMKSPLWNNFQNFWQLKIKHKAGGKKHTLMCSVPFRRVMGENTKQVSRLHKNYLNGGFLIFICNHL